MLSVKGWGDILPDPLKYHSYSRTLFIDNIVKYPKYRFIVLSKMNIGGYPSFEIIEESGNVPSTPKWSEIYIVTVEKNLLDTLDHDEAAAEIASLIESRDYKPFPISTANGLYMENKYPVKREEFHYKIKSIKDSKAVLKLHRIVIEFLDGTEVSEDIK